MSNKAFGIHRRLKKAGQVDPLDELRRRRVAACVITEIANDEKRPYSVVELLGHAWRKRHGFGRPYMKLGGRGSGYGRRAERQAAEAARKRKLQKAARSRQRAALVERMGRVFSAAKKVLARKAGRGQ